MDEKSWPMPGVTQKKTNRNIFSVVVVMVAQCFCSVAVFPGFPPWLNSVWFCNLMCMCCCFVLRTQKKKQHCDNVLANDPTYNMCVRGCVVFFHMFADPGGPFKYNVCHLIGETVFYVCWPLYRAEGSICFMSFFIVLSIKAISLVLLLVSGCSVVVNDYSTLIRVVFRSPSLTMRPNERKTCTGLNIYRWKCAKSQWAMVKQSNGAIWSVRLSRLPKISNRICVCAPNRC